MFKAMLVSCLCGALLAGSGAWYLQDLRWTRKGALYRASAASELAQATSTARDRENGLQARVDALASLYDKQKEKTNAENAAVLSALRSSRVRLSAPAVSCTPAPTSATPGADAPGTCELHAGTSEALAALTGRADSLALKLNALQDYVRGLNCGAQHGTFSE